MVAFVVPVPSLGLPAFRAEPINYYPRHLHLFRTRITPRSTALNPVVILPGLGNAASDYDRLAQRLRDRGHVDVSVVPIQRWQWLLNALGFFSREYWTGTLTPSPILDWYFNRVEMCLRDVQRRHPDRAIGLVGHSAGGWLARVFLKDNGWDGLVVDVLITLGTPNLAPREEERKWPDQTRGLLDYVENKCCLQDSAVLGEGGVVCVSGEGMLGKRSIKSWSKLLAFVSYEAVCGRGDVDGDGVTPCCAAVVKGATEVRVRCEHSMLTAGDGGWYGAEHVVDDWAGFLS